MLEYSNGRWVLQARGVRGVLRLGGTECLLQTATNTRPSGQPRSFERYKVEDDGEQIFLGVADVSC